MSRPLEAARPAAARVLSIDETPTPHTPDPWREPRLAVLLDLLAQFGGHLPFDALTKMLERSHSWHRAEGVEAITHAARDEFVEIIAQPAIPNSPRLKLVVRLTTAGRAVANAS